MTSEGGFSNVVERMLHRDLGLTLQQMRSSGRRIAD